MIIEIRRQANQSSCAPCRSSILAVFFLLLPLVLGAANAAADGVPKTGAQTLLDEHELGRFQYCGYDRDCLLANNGCCDCANGGQDVSVSRYSYEKFKERFDCSHVSCGDKYSYPECGSGVVACIRNKCQYISNLEFELKGSALRR